MLKTTLEGLKKLMSWLRSDAGRPGGHSSASYLTRRLPPEVLALILGSVDQQTLLSVAHTCRSLRIDAERLLYRSVYLSDISRVHALAVTLDGPENFHRSLAIRRLTVVYSSKRPARKGETESSGLAAIKAVLQRAPNLLHFSIWKPGMPQFRPRRWRVFRRPIDQNFVLYQLEARSEHNRQRTDYLCPSVRTFKTSGTLEAGESADILRAFLSSTTPLPSLAIEVWYRSPEILSVIPDHLPCLRNLEILDPDPYAYAIDAVHFLEPIVKRLQSLEKFKLRGGWMAWSTQSGQQMVNSWSLHCPSLRHVKLDWGAEWIRVEDGWKRHYVEPRWRRAPH